MDLARENSQKCRFSNTVFSHYCYPFIPIDDRIDGSKYQISLTFVGGDVDIEVFHDDLKMCAIVGRKMKNEKNFDFLSCFYNMLVVPC